MPLQSIQSEWLQYKRYSDNVKLEARLVEWEGRKLMEVKTSSTGPHLCPECKCTLSVGIGRKGIMTTFLEVADFHAKHKPIS